MAHALFRLPDGGLAQLLPGEFIGRSRGAGLRIDDARISEAHALLSLRGGELVLLALRGALGQHGLRASSIVLRPGARIALCDGLEMEVEAVLVPDRVLSLEGFGPLTGCSVLSLGEVIVSRYEAGAAAWIWSTSEGFEVQIGEADPRPLRPGVLELPSGPLRVEEVAVAAGEPAPTQQPGRLHRPLELRVRYDTVHLERSGLPAVVLTGLQARLVSELALCEAPLRWDELAGELWPGEEERSLLRQRLDRVLQKLRKKLKAGGLRPDLVRSSGGGFVELVVRVEDQVIDET